MAHNFTDIHTNIRRYLKNMALLCRPVPPTRPPEECFFVLTSGRSGSNWLADTLNRHPELSCLVEPANHPEYTLLKRIIGLPHLELRERDRRSPLKKRHALWPVIQFCFPIVKLHYWLSSSGKRRVGAKILWPQLIYEMQTFKFFTTYRESRFILLNRSSLTDMLCSVQVANKTRTWLSSNEVHTHIEPFALDMGYARWTMELQLFLRGCIEHMVSALGISVLHLTYEEMMEDKEKALASIADFLGVWPFTQQSDQKKLIVQPYRDIVTNYDDILALERELKAVAAGRALNSVA